jgi:hypothetical protein
MCNFALAVSLISDPTMKERVALHRKLKERLASLRTQEEIDLYNLIRDMPIPSENGEIGQVHSVYQGHVTVTFPKPEKWPENCFGPFVTYSISDFLE